MSIFVDKLIIIEYNEQKAQFNLSMSGGFELKIDCNKIEILQAKAGMTGAQVAEAAGISRQFFSTIKNRGTCRPSSALVIANALGVDVTEIMEETKQ